MTVHRNEKIIRGGTDECYVDCTISATNTDYVNCVFVRCRFTKRYTYRSAQDCEFITSEPRFTSVTSTNLRYIITWFREHISIGCKSFTVSEWASFSDEAIKALDREALRWWRRHKEYVISEHGRLFGVMGS